MAESLLFIIEDNAQAIGADYIFSDATTKKAGSIGDFGYEHGDLPVSEGLSSKVLLLPMHTDFDEEQLTYITNHIHAYFNF